MPTYNKEMLQLYYDTRNFEAAAQYLRSIPAKDAEHQRIVNEQISQLEDNAALQESLLSDLSEDEHDYFTLVQAINGDGTIPYDRNIRNTRGELIDTQRNKFGTRYLKNINTLKANDGTDISKLAIDVDSSDNLALLSKQLGFDSIDRNDIGITMQKLNNGSYRLTFDKGNKNLYKIINAVDEINSASFNNIMENILKKTIGFTGAGAGIGSAIPGLGTIAGGVIGMGTGLAVGVGQGMYQQLTNSNAYSIKAIGSNGQAYSDEEFNVNNVRNAVDIINDAKETYDKILANREKERSFDSEMVVTQFLGTGHAESYDNFVKGKITRAEYEQQEKEWKDAYDRLIQNNSFANFDVYTWRLDSKEGALLTPMDNDEKKELQAEVLYAMTKNRVSYSLATIDGETGTKITILPDQDNKGNWSKGKGDVYTEIFIPKLMDDSGDAVFERDTKTKAAKQNSKLKRYNYHKTLTNGNVVGYEQGVGPYIKKPDGNGSLSVQYISEADILHALNEDAIVTNSVNEVLANMDKNGNLYPYLQNGNWITQSVENMLNVLAAAGVNELYPPGTTNDVNRVYQQNVLYRRMLDIVNNYRKNYQRK